MTEINWIQVAAGVLGGGAVGAIITNIVTTYRARRQPVGYRIDTVPVFKGTLGSSDFKASLVVEDGGKHVEFENLFVLEIQIVNRGNKDFLKLPFGFTLAQQDRAVFVESVPPDRFHKAVFQSRPSPIAPHGDIDISLEPFNRGDVYKFRLFVVIPNGSEAPGTVVLGSPEAVVFKALPTLNELAAAAARGIILRVGPAKVTFFQ